VIRNILLGCILLTLFKCKQLEKKQINEEKEIEYSNENNDNWIYLFDGTSFDSWRGYLSDEMYPEWQIEDGVMSFTPGEVHGKNIITKQKFTSFILSLEWKVSEGGNSGIFWGIYEDEKYPEAYETGIEIQVIDNERHPDAKEREGTHAAGSLYDMIAYPPEYVNPAGEWNLCVIEVNQETNLGKVSMNGKTPITFPVHGPEWEAMIANSKFKDWEGFGKNKTGHIGLQDHSDQVWYRNIKILKLD
jgi:hypothetical protein